MAQAASASLRAATAPMTQVPKARWWNEETRFAWASLVPALIFFGTFVGFPFAYSFYLSFHEWNMMAEKPTWVGLENYTALIREPEFLKS
ncbi:MAG: hypothetical protein ACKVQQ_16570, partial [Burkholderiales bacterium]